MGQRHKPYDPVRESVERESICSPDSSSLSECETLIEFERSASASSRASVHHDGEESHSGSSTPIPKRPGIEPHKNRSPSLSDSPEAQEHPPSLSSYTDWARKKPGPSVRPETDGENPQELTGKRSETSEGLEWVKPHWKRSKKDKMVYMRGTYRRKRVLGPASQKPRGELASASPPSLAAQGPGQIEKIKRIRLKMKVRSSQGEREDIPPGISTSTANSTAAELSEARAQIVALTQEISDIRFETRMQIADLSQELFLVRERARIDVESAQQETVNVRRETALEIADLMWYLDYQETRAEGEIERLKGQLDGYRERSAFRGRE